MTRVKPTGIGLRGVGYCPSMDTVAVPRMTKARLRGLQSGQMPCRALTWLQRELTSSHGKIVPKHARARARQRRFQ